MRVAIMKPLFDWESLEDSPSLSSVRFLLQTIPDAKLLQCLEQARGKGRDDYPCHVLWGVVLLTMILRHPSFEACLGDLRRNAQLRRLIGIESESAVPKKWNISRFLRRLGQPMALLLMREAFDRMSRRLSECVPDLGAKTAGDATQLNARRARDKEGAAEEEAQGLPEASCGKKEYTDDDGKVAKVLEWFGYKLHLIVDVKHEVTLAYKVTASGVGDGQTLPEVLAQAQGNLPERRCRPWPTTRQRTHTRSTRPSRELA